MIQPIRRAAAAAGALALCGAMSAASPALAQETEELPRFLVPGVRVRGIDYLLDVDIHDLIPPSRAGRPFTARARVSLFRDGNLMGDAEVGVVRRQDRRRHEFRWRFSRLVRRYAGATGEIRTSDDGAPRFAIRRVDLTLDDWSISPKRPFRVRSGARGESVARRPLVSGAFVRPTRGADLGPVTSVLLERVLTYNSRWIEVASDVTGDASFAFRVDPDPALEETPHRITVTTQQGLQLSAVFFVGRHDVAQDVSTDSMLVPLLVQMTFVPPPEAPSVQDPIVGFGSAPDHFALLRKLLADATVAVGRRTAADGADRRVDGLRSWLLDRLNVPGTPPAPSFQTVRAYGGGIEGFRTLDDILQAPLPPLRTGFTFTRFNAAGEYDAGIASLDTARWDILSGNGIFPHVATGGDRVVFVRPTAATYPGRYVLGVFTRSLAGSEAPVLLTPPNLDCADAAWSPDQAWIVFSARTVVPGIGPVADEPYNLYLMIADGSAIVKLTDDSKLRPYAGFEVDGNLFASWSPDGGRIAFVHQLNTDQGVEENRLETVAPWVSGYSRTIVIDTASSGQRAFGSPNFSPDGTALVFHGKQQGRADFDVMLTDASRSVSNPTTVVAYSEAPADETDPSWSHDGRFLIFSSTRDGEPARAPGLTWLRPYFVRNIQTGEIVADLGDFASAGHYSVPRFTATATAIVAAPGVPTDAAGNVVVSPGADPRTDDDHSELNLHRVIIPAANAAGINLGYVPSWFGD